MAPDRGHSWGSPPGYTQPHESDRTTGGPEEARLLSAAPQSSSTPQPLDYRDPSVDIAAGESSDGDDWIDYSQLDPEYGSRCGAHLEEFDIQEPEISCPSVGQDRIWNSLRYSGLLERLRFRFFRLRLPFASRRGPGDHSDFSLVDNPDLAGAAARARDRPCFKTNIIRRFSLIWVGRGFVVVFLLASLYFLFAPRLFLTSPQTATGSQYTTDILRQHLLDDVEPTELRLLVEHFTRFSHLAGTEGDYGMAMDLASMFRRAGLQDVSMDEYQVYLNYPTDSGRSVQILDSDSGAIEWTAELEEDDFLAGVTHPRTHAFHAHSRSGDVRGPLIYANYGSLEDYQYLADLKINTTGAVALLRQRASRIDNVGLMVKAAELAGFAACVVYSDPADEAFLMDASGQSGPSLPPDRVRRGSVSLPNWVIGDVLTPGWESKRGLPRLHPNQSRGLIGIPSIPLAWRDAQVLLQRIARHGQPVPKEWIGGVPGLSGWWTGDSTSPIVRLQNEQDEMIQKSIWNVYGALEGTEQGSKRIILGNQRDSLAIGATEPHGGTAVLIALARILGAFYRDGWRPLRSIEFTSWDAAAYNFIGSTEFVERHIKELRNDAVAYINIDSIVAGDELFPSGSPVFTDVLNRIMKRLLMEPGMNVSIPQSFQDRIAIQPMDYAGDYVPFMTMAGTSSLDLRFTGQPFPQQSIYDNAEWVSQIGDPSWIFHAFMTQIVGLLILDLSDRQLLPFDLVSYANSLTEWVQQLDSWVSGVAPLIQQEHNLTLDPLSKAVSAVKDAALAADAWSMDWQRKMLSTGWVETDALKARRLEYNHQLGAFDTMLLDLDRGGGLPLRPQFRHVVFGPQQWSLTGDLQFPAIREAVSAGDWDRASSLVNKTTTLLQTIAEMLSAWG